MDATMYRQAVALAERRQHVLIATTNLQGIPHLASVGAFAALSQRHLVLSDWHCKITLRNLRSNPQIAIVVWDIATDTGYQFDGVVEDVPEATSTQELLVRVDAVEPFSHAPHDDAPAEKVQILPDTSLIIAERKSESQHSVHLHVQQDSVPAANRQL